VQGMTRHEKARVESPTGKVDVDWDMRTKTKTEERERVHFDFASSLPGKLANKEGDASLAVSLEVPILCGHFLLHLLSPFFPLSLSLLLSSPPSYRILKTLLRGSS